MRKCKKCGCEVYSTDKVCFTCMQKWRQNREIAYSKTVSELGEHSHLNSKQFIKRLKQIEKCLP